MGRKLEQPTHQKQCSQHLAPSPGGEAISMVDPQCAMEPDYRTQDGQRDGELPHGARGRAYLQHGSRKQRRPCERIQRRQPLASWPIVRVGSRVSNEDDPHGRSLLQATLMS